MRRHLAARQTEPKVTMFASGSPSSPPARRRKHAIGPGTCDLRWRGCGPSELLALSRIDQLMTELGCCRKMVCSVWMSETGGGRWRTSTHVNRGIIPILERRALAYTL